MDKIAKIEEHIEQSGVLRDIVASLSKAQRGTPVSVPLPRCSYRSIVAKIVARLLDKTLLYVSNDEDSAGYVFSDMRAIANQQSAVSDDSIMFFPSLKGASVSDEGRIIMRNRVLEALTSSYHPVIVSYPNALTEYVAAKEERHRLTKRIAKGDSIDITQLAIDLNELGLVREDFVYAPGQYSVRGSIVDIFSWSSEMPYRLDFFGDEVDTIRTFDIQNQLSVDKLEFCIVQGKVSDTDSSASILDYLDSDTLILTDNYELLADKLGSELSERLKANVILDFFASSSVSTVKPAPVFNKNYESLISYLRTQEGEGKRVMIAIENVRQMERLETIISDLSKHNSVSVSYLLGTLHAGFETDSCVLLLEHEIFGRYHRYSLTSKDTRRGKEALTLRELKNMSVGDYVVHDDFGIGVFAGLVKQTRNGYEEESIRINYKDGDILMVSLSALHKVSKYSGGDTASVKITKLGSARWENLKERTKSKLKDIARDLILLYAKRKEEKGYAFSADSFLQAELESSFEFQDTPDQAKATQDIKRDMERERPMDRLVCGDVGFGKTEIAIRAAVKACADNKQVAVLVPTTVLAFQHYKTFQRRLRDLPIKVDYLSRTRSASEVRSILSQLAIGNINVIIGTHKLIGKNVRFHDLGLLVIDEEQKFGVAAKEKIKQMKVNVDTLTLTATPIPRTLQFSLLGARDLSVINTPPAGRFPIDTRLERFDEKVIAHAIDYELRRGGQVLFVNNNIKELDGLKALIEKLIPTTRVVIAHGRMDGEEIESRMLEFVQGDYDVLLSTSIIESGIDISNCNTILINNAQNFGLSDLHQLRGRVGRNNVQAYCYLFSPPLVAMSDEARKRLEAITTYTELGSGLNIAMRDLDIRGAGNLLGAEQSGFIADLGFETYKKILAEAIRELRSGEFREVYAEEDSAKDETDEILARDCAMDTDIPALFPEDYVENVTERLALYRELDSMQSETALDRFRENLVDRFGQIPAEAENLILLISVRFHANALGFEKLVAKKGKIIAFLTPDRTAAYYSSDTFGKIISYLGAHPYRCLLSENKAGKPYVEIRDVSSLQECYDLLRSIKQL